MLLQKLLQKLWHPKIKTYNHLKKIKNTVEVHNIFSLAEVLHKTASEILQMSVTEFNMWIAYFELKREEQERQQRIAQMKRK